MNDETKTKEELLAELKRLRQEVAELRAIEYDRGWAEATFRDYLRFLGTLVNTLPNPVFYQDSEGCYLGCNDIFAKQVIGLPKEKILGRTVDHFPDIIPPKIAKLYRNKDSELIRNPGVQTYEAAVRCADGMQRDFVFARATFADSMNNIAGIIGVMSDITERKLLRATLLQNNLELALLNRASQEFISSLNLDQVLMNVLEEARQLLDVTACSAWLIDPKTGELVCEHTTGKGVDGVLGWRLALGQGIAGWVAQHVQSTIVSDTRQDYRHFKQVDEELGIEIRSILSVPLKIGDKVIGVLHAVDESIDRFSSNELRLMEPLAYNAAIAIENAHLYKQAQQDAKTKEILLREVNHRVKNNLAAIIGLLYAEQSRLNQKSGVSYQTVLDELINRVQGLSTVHELLSATQWQPLLLTELTEQIINSVLQTVPFDRKVSVNILPASVLVTAEEAHELALVINELTTNSVKYALAQNTTPLQITVKLAIENNHIVCFEFSDNGPGYPTDILQRNQQRYNIGFDLIEGIVQSSLRGQLFLNNNGGAVTTIKFKSENS